MLQGSKVQGSDKTNRVSNRMGEYWVGEEATLVKTSSGPVQEYHLIPTIKFKNTISNVLSILKIPVFIHFLLHTVCEKHTIIQTIPSLKHKNLTYFIFSMCKVQALFLFSV
jgi:hypothetical protein